MRRTKRDLRFELSLVKAERDRLRVLLDEANKQTRLAIEQTEQLLALIERS